MAEILKVGLVSFVIAPQEVGRKANPSGPGKVELLRHARNILRERREM